MAVLCLPSNIVSKTGSSPRASQLIPSVAQPCLDFILTSQHFDVPDNGSSCRAISLAWHEFASLAGNCCCPPSKLSDAGASADWH